MNRFVLANPSLCIGCYTCVASCAEIHEANGLQPEPRITIVSSGEISSPIACLHCENAPCAAVCPVDAITMGDSSVVLNEATCIGCKLCVFVCPFGVITLSSSKDDSLSLSLNAAGQEGKKARTVAVKCDLCDFSQDGPECIRVCPTEALFLVDEKTLKRSNEAKLEAAVKNLPSIENPADKKA